MATAWTKTAKPTTSWTGFNVPSKHTYDDVLVLYDDPSVEYDGNTGTGWISVPKPATSSLWSAGVFPWMLPLPWQYPASTVWTDVPKAT